MDMDGTWNWCPECGKMTWIPKDRKTGVCFNCNAFVLNWDWEGWDEKKPPRSSAQKLRPGEKALCTLVLAVILFILLKSC